MFKKLFKSKKGENLPEIVSSGHVIKKRGVSENTVAPNIKSNSWFQKRENKKLEEVEKTVQITKRIFTGLREVNIEAGKMETVEDEVDIYKNQVQEELQKSVSSLKDSEDEECLREHRRKTKELKEKEEQEESLYRIADLKAKRKVLEHPPEQPTPRPKKSQKEVVAEKINKESEKGELKDMAKEKMQERLKAIYEKGVREEWTEEEIRREQERETASWHQLYEKLFS